MGSGGARVAVATLRRKVGTMRFLYARGGVRGFGRRLLAKLGYRSVVVFERRFETSPALVEPGLALSYAFLTIEDAAAYAAHRPDLGPDVVSELFGSGDRCYVARADGVIVTSRWVAVGPKHIRSMGVEVELAPGQAYIYEAFTDPAHRGRRASPGAGSRLARQLADERCRGTISFVQKDNLSGMRNAELTGARPTETISRLVLGPLRVQLRRGGKTGARFADGHTGTAQLGRLDSTPRASTRTGAHDAR